MSPVDLSTHMEFFSYVTTSYPASTAALHVVCTLPSASLLTLTTATHQLSPQDQIVNPESLLLVRVDYSILKSQHLRDMRLTEER